MPRLADFPQSVGARNKARKKARSGGAGGGRRAGGWGAGGRRWNCISAAKAFAETSRYNLSQILSQRETWRSRFHMMLTFGALQLSLPTKIGGVCFRVSPLAPTEKKKKKMSLEEA